MVTGLTALCLLCEYAQRELHCWHVISRTWPTFFHFLFSPRIAIETLKEPLIRSKTFSDHPPHSTFGILDSSKHLEGELELSILSCRHFTKICRSLKVFIGLCAEI